MQYRKNPDLPFIAAKTGRAGNPYEGREFKYEQDPFQPEWGIVLKMMLAKNPQKAEKKADKWTPPVSEESEYLDDKSAEWITWLGHACFLVQLNGTRMLIDPQLSDMPFIARRVTLPFGPEEIRDIDFLLLSHDHRDHVDKKSIQRIVANNLGMKILCPLGLRKVIQPWVDLADDTRGYEPTTIEEAAWYQIYDTGQSGVRITFLPSRHWCRRGLLDFNRVLWGGFMIERSGEPARNGLNTIYFGGDSAQTTYWKEIGELYPDIDIAMLGVGAYSPAFMMQDNHANPAEAFQGFLDVGAQLWWPMHHGTYDLSWEPAGEPLRWAQRLMEEAGMPERLVGQVINLPFRGR